MSDPLSVSKALLLFGAGLFGLAAVQDAGWRLVPNAVPMAIAVDGLVLRALDRDLVLACGIAGAVFLMAAACWRRGWLGGADVKLFAAGALLVTPARVSDFVLATVLAGGVLACGYWLLGRVAPRPEPRRPRVLLWRLWRAECRRLRRGGPLPYAMALAAGLLFTLTRS